MPPVLARRARKITFALALAVLPALSLTRPMLAQEAPPPVPVAPALPTVAVPPADGPSDAEEKPETAKGIPSESLEDALKNSRMARPIIVMAVGAREPMAAKQKDGSVEKLAIAYNLAQRQFGWVLAVGPLEMTLLNTDLGDPNPYNDMPPNEAMTLLMSSLTDAQRGKLTGKEGLGLSDLKDDMQKHLFQTMMPKDQCDVNQRTEPGKDDVSVTLDNMGIKALGAKLRIKQEVQILTKGKQDYYSYVQTYSKVNDKPVFNLNDYSAYNNLDKLGGIAIRITLPNAPKQSQLDILAPALQAAVSPDGVKTVGELIERIAKATGWEIYADTHYEKRPLTLRIGRKTAPAADLLRALAFCVTGTYRRIGPAYVLTDDIVGVGTRRQIINDYQDECSAMRHQSLKAAEKALQGNDALQKTKLANFDDALAMTPEEEKNGKKPEWQSPGVTTLNLPLDKLTPEQQKAVQASVTVQEKYAKQYPDSGFEIPDLTKEIQLTKQPVVEMVLPGVDGPIRTEFGAQLAPLFAKSTARPAFDAEELRKTLIAINGEKVWKDESAKMTRRAWIAHPRSRDAVDAALRRAKQFGLNELWISVFEEGKALIPGTPFPIIPALRDAPDLLTYAIEAAKAQNIKVCPVVQMFAWGTDAPAELRDRNIRGEDSAQDDARRYRLRVLKLEEGRTKPNPPKQVVYVNPFDESVQKNLRGLMKALAAHPGIGDWVWNDAVSPGYVKHQYYYGNTVTILGYNEAGRLSALRSMHIDPIDIKSSREYYQEHRVNTALPSYDNNDYQDDNGNKWDVLHEFTLRNALKKLYADAIADLPEKSRPNVLLMQGNKAQFQTWYDQWTPSESNPPELTDQIYYSRQEAAVVNGEAKPAVVPKVPSGFFRLILPHHFGPIAIAEKDVPALLGLELQQLANMKSRIWSGFAIEEEDFDIDF